MIQKISQKITVFLLQENAIEKKYASTYTYGLELIISGILSILSVMLVSILIGLPYVGIAFLIIFIPLRMYTGGYHADTYLKCNVLFMGVYLFSVMLYLVCLKVNIIQYSFVLMIISFIIISFRAPIENENKRITSEKKKQYRLVSLLITFALISISLLSFNLYKNISLLINITLFVIAMLMLITGEEANQNEKVS